jgi:hypothetical protein
MTDTSIKSKACWNRRLENILEEKIQINEAQIYYNRRSIPLNTRILG